MAVLKFGCIVGSNGFGALQPGMSVRDMQGTCCSICARVTRTMAVESLLCGKSGSTDRGVSESKNIMGSITAGLQATWEFLKQTCLEMRWGSESGTSRTLVTEIPAENPVFPSLGCQ